MTMPDASMSPTVSHDQDPLLTPIESLLEMAAPGKESDQEAENLQMVLDGMRDGDLLELVSLAYQEDPEANSLLLSKATAILDERGRAERRRTSCRS